MPYSEKTITTKVPKLNGVDAKSVNVVGKDISFENKDNAITINKINNKTEEGFVNTDTSSDYVVTAIYETQVETAEIEIESEIKTKLICV